MAGHKGVIVVRKTKTRKTFLVFTVNLQNAPRACIYFLLAGSELDFFVCLSEMLHQKSVKAALQVYLSKCVPGL